MMRRGWLKLRRWLRGKWFDWRERQHNDEGEWCMCGSRCADHGWGDNHGPVPAWHYLRDQYVRKGEKE